MELKELLKNLAKEFGKNNLNYMIIGGQAVLIYGEPRLTKDVDITIDGGIEKLDTVINIAKSLELKILPQNPHEFVKKTMVLPMLDERTGLRIDVIFSCSPYEKEALKRVNKIEIDDTEINYASVEDLIIHKIISGRERDLEDIKSIMLKNKNIDENYILKWLEEFEKDLNMKFKDSFFKIKKEIEK